MIDLELDRPTTIELELFDVLGRRIGKQSFRGLTSGRTQLSWNPDSSVDSAPGVYFYRITGADQILSGPILKTR